MADPKTKLPGGVTQAQLDKWKKEHGEVKEVEVPLDDTGKNTVTCFVKKPNIDILGAAAAVAETDPMKSGLILFDNCYLGGDPETKGNEEVKMSVIVALKSMFRVRVATIKNV
ncbi:MAG: hypothetical protein AB7P01_06085 [Bacteroidia bacterium]